MPDTTVFIPFCEECHQPIVPWGEVLIENGAVTERYCLKPMEWRNALRRGAQIVSEQYRQEHPNWFQELRS